MKKIIILIIVIILSFPINVFTEDLGIVSEGAVLIDYKTGRILYGKNENKLLGMASTTKIMTAIIAIEDGNLNDIVTVSRNAEIAPKVKMYLTEGEEIKLEYLLYALMLESSNDAAVAIAEHVHGSVEEFTKVMTKKAKSLGAVNTTFETPNGLDSQNPNHESTAYDMALIMKYALDNEKLMEIMNTKSITFNSDKRQYSFDNKNRLLDTYTGANGGKTGFTNKAGQCFVGAAKRGDMQLISTVLASGWGDSGKERKWIDTEILLDYGFDNYEYVQILDGRNDVGKINILNSKTTEIPVYFESNLLLPLNEDEKKSLEIQNSYVETLEAPILNNQKIGTSKIIANGITLAQYDIITDGKAEIFDFISVSEDIINNWFKLGTTNDIDNNLRPFMEKYKKELT